MTQHTPGQAAQPFQSLREHELEEIIRLLRHVPHSKRFSATHRMLERVAGCPGCDARALLARVEEKS